ncbi:hypothetical protein MRX96_031577 [Rhipicephalus microplus]
MVLLFIIDVILLYFWLTSTRTRFHRTVTKTIETARRLSVPGLSQEDGEDSYLLLEEISPNLNGWQSRQRMCNTAGCLWLRDYLRPGNKGSSHIQSQGRSPPHPCDDFHEHVCGSRQQSIYEDGVSRLMDAVKARLLGALRTAAKGSEAAKGASERDKVHARLLQRCLDGAAVVTEDDITRACGSIQNAVCPNSVPEAPLRISEDFFQNNPNASVAGYAAFVESLAANLSWKTHSQSHAVKVPSKPSRWFARLCRWVATSARCHFARRPQWSGQRPDAQALYERLWKVLYFAPLMGNKAQPLVKHAYERLSSKPQLRACLRFIEDVSSKRTAVTARAVLSDAVDSLDDTITHFVMRALVPAWLGHPGPNVTGSIINDDEKLRADTEHASQRLGAIDVNLLPHDDADATSPSNAQYVAERKSLLVPLGLLGLLLNASSIIEPVLVPALGREVMRVLMPTSRGPYAWRSRNERHFRALVECVASDLDTDDVEETLARRTTLESALLEPLMVLYKRRLKEELGRGVRLHGDYGNAELFFVLWALNHCGERDAETIVNGALRNSALFARAFQCSVNQAMWSGMRCSFWH